MEMSGLAGGVGGDAGLELVEEEETAGAVFFGAGRNSWDVWLVGACNMGQSSLRAVPGGGQYDLHSQSQSSPSRSLSFRKVTIYC